MNNKGVILLDILVGVFISSLIVGSLFILPKKVLENNRLVINQMDYTSSYNSLNNYMSEDIRSNPGLFKKIDDSNFEIGEYLYTFDNGVYRSEGEDVIEIYKDKLTFSLKDNLLEIDDEVGSLLVYNINYSNIPTREGEYRE